MKTTGSLVCGLLRSPTYLTTPIRTRASSPSLPPLLCFTATRSPIVTGLRSGGLRRLVQWAVSARTVAQCEHRQQENFGFSRPGIHDPSWKEQKIASESISACLLYTLHVVVLAQLFRFCGAMALQKRQSFLLGRLFRRFERTASISLAPTTREILRMRIECYADSY